MRPEAVHSKIRLVAGRIFEVHLRDLCRGTRSAPVSARICVEAPLLLSARVR